jgi:hypothetical protein
MKVTHVVCFERYRAEKHCIKANSKTPNIWGKSFVASTTWLASKKDFRRYIGGGTTLFSHNIVLRVCQELANAEIAKLQGDISFSILRSRVTHI